MFPLQIAHQLGITLQQDAVGASGVEGVPFPTWSAQESIMGQIVRVDPQTKEAELWGMPFQMTPAFCEKRPFLLGREDFFSVLKVQFLPGNPHPSFVVEF